MQQNARVAAFTVSGLLKENHLGVGGWGGLNYPPPTQIRVKTALLFSQICLVHGYLLE